MVPANINSDGQCVIGGASRAVEDAIAPSRPRASRHSASPSAMRSTRQSSRRRARRCARCSTGLTSRSPSDAGDLQRDRASCTPTIPRHQGPARAADRVAGAVGAGARDALRTRLPGFVEVGPKTRAQGLRGRGSGRRDGVMSIADLSPKDRGGCDLQPGPLRPVGRRYTARDRMRGGATRQAYSERECRSGAGEKGTRNGQAHAEDGEMKRSNGSNGHMASDRRGGETSSGRIRRLGDERRRRSRAGADARAGSHGADERPAVAASGSFDCAAPAPWDRTVTPAGSVVISGTGLGLPGTEKPLMDPDNALRVLQRRATDRAWSPSGSAARCWPSGSPAW